MAPPDTSENDKPKKSLPERQWNKFDRTFKGVWQDTTKVLSQKIEKSTEGKITASAAQSFVPLVAGVGAAVLGFVFLAPLTSIGRGIGTAAKKVVTGFGLFKGAVFTAAASTIEVVAETLGVAAVAVGSLITFKMFQPTPPPVPEGQNLDTVEKRKDEDKITHVVVPIGPKATEVPKPKAEPRTVEERIDARAEELMKQARAAMQDVKVKVRAVKPSWGRWIANIVTFGRVSAGTVPRSVVEDIVNQGREGAAADAARKQAVDEENARATAETARQAKAAKNFDDVMDWLKGGGGKLGDGSKATLEQQAAAKELLPVDIALAKEAHAERVKAGTEKDGDFAADLVARGQAHLDLKRAQEWLKGGDGHLGEPRKATAEEQKAGEALTEADIALAKKAHAERIKAGTNQPGDFAADLVARGQARIDGNPITAAGGAAVAKPKSIFRPTTSDFTKGAHKGVLVYAAGASFVIGLQELNGKYTPAKVGDHFDHDGKTYKLITALPPEDSFWQNAGRMVVERQNFIEIDETRMPVASLPRTASGLIDIAALVKEHPEAIIQRDAAHYKVDPTSKIHATTEFVNSGAMTAMMLGSKRVAPGAAIFVIVAQDGMKVIETGLNKGLGAAAQEAGKDIVVDGGKLAVMMIVPGGVAIVMTGDTIAEIDAICDDVARKFPTAERTYFVKGKDGKPEPITLKNAYKLNPNFKTAVEQAALAGDGPLTDEARQSRTEEMLSDPLYAWQMVWDHKMPQGYKIADYAEDQNISEEEATRKLLDEYAAQTSIDAKPNALFKFISSFAPVDSLTAEAQWAGHALNFGSDKSFGERINTSLTFSESHMEFESDATKAELIAIAQELKRYNSQVNATKENLATGTGVAGEHAPVLPVVKGLTNVAVPSVVPPVERPAVEKGAGSVTEVGWKQNTAALQGALEDGMVTYYRKRHADDLTLLLRYDAQRHENAVTFVKDIRTALNPKSAANTKAQDGRSQLMAVLKAQAHLTDDEAKSLVVSPPKLNISVMPELEGFDRDSADIPKPLEAFGVAFQKKYTKEFILLQNTGGKVISKKYGDVPANERTTFVAKDFKDMSVTEKNEFLNAALKYCDERVAWYEDHSTVAVSEDGSAKLFNYSADGGGSNAFGRFFREITDTFNGTFPNADLDLPHGSIKFRDEHRFLTSSDEGSIFASLKDYLPGSIVSDQLKLDEQQKVYVTAQDDTKKQDIRSFLRGGLTGLSSNIGAHMEYVRRHETQDNGDIREYIRKARFMEASLALSNKGILLLASNKTNNGIDPMTGKIHDDSDWVDNSWILFKDMRNGKYYYAEGEWGSNSPNPDAPKEDFFRITHIKDQKTGERVAVESIEGSVINFSDASKDTTIAAKGLSARPGAITEAVDKTGHLTPREKYEHVYHTMRAEMPLPGSLIKRSDNDIDIARYDALQGDKTMTLGQEASIDCDDFNTGLKYTLKGKWALTDEGDMFLKTDKVVVHNMPGVQKDMEIAITANDNPKRLREKILTEYLAKVTPQERADLFRKLDYVAYPEVEKGAIMMPTIAQRQKAMADGAVADKLAAEKLKADSLVAVKKKIAEWVDAGKITVELDPDKKVESYPFAQPIGSRMNEDAMVEAINLRSSVVMQLTDKEQQEFMGMLVKAGIKIPSFQSKKGNLSLDSMRLGLTKPSTDPVIATFDNDVRVDFNDIKSLISAEAVREYYQVCVHCSPRKRHKNDPLNVFRGIQPDNDGLELFINAGRGDLDTQTADRNNPFQLNITPRTNPRNGSPAIVRLDGLSLDSPAPDRGAPTEDPFKLMFRVDPKLAGRPDSTHPVTLPGQGDELQLTLNPSQAPKKTSSKIVWRRGYAMTPLEKMALTDGDMLMAPGGARLATRPVVNEGPLTGGELRFFVDKPTDTPITSHVTPTRLPTTLNITGIDCAPKPKGP